MMAPDQARFGARSRFGGFLHALCLLVMGCADRSADPEAERALEELARMVYAPAAEVVRVPGDPRTSTIGALEVDLLVDRYEVSRADWSHWTGESLEPDGVAATELHLAWPAFASFEDARDFARLRSMRLPTVGEWVFLASSARARGFPWGILSRESVANTSELGLLRPTPVGTFENGATPNGIYDLVGNVFEWAESDGTPVGLHNGEVPFEGQVAALGGSYLYRLRASVLGEDGAPFAQGLVLGESSVGPDLGLRCVVEAETFLATFAERWEGLPDARARLITIGMEWGASAVALLDRLARAEPDHAAYEWLLDGARR
ncbi:MAG: formylglycine-generating enzyme family protein [Planctomycetota bacterium]|jgi:hypothetical protein